LFTGEDLVYVVTFAGAGIADWVTILNATDETVHYGSPEDIGGTREIRPTTPAPIPRGTVIDFFATGWTKVF
jgi:hypothetical protein